MKVAHTRSLAVAAALCVIGNTAMAASIDLRHEFRGRSEQHATRLKLNESFSNGIYFSTELKFKGSNGEFMESLQNNGSEFDWGYRHRINENWTLQPGMPIELGSNYITYKPQMRVTYAFSDIPGLSVSGRYRYDFRRYSEDRSGVDGVMSRKRHRLTYNVNYSINNWSLGMEGNFYKAENYELFKGRKVNQEYNFVARYRMGSWRPYVEFGTADYDSSGENASRELRSRVGVSYSF